MSYIKVIALGGIGSSEVWSVSMTYRNFELFPATMTQTMIESLANRLITGIPSASFPSGLKVFMSSSLVLKGWRVEQRGEDEQLENVGEAYYATPITGSGTATKTPQDATVISLRTSTPGARGRGRLYWPAAGATLGADFRMTSTAASTLLSAAKTLLKLIGDQINAEWAANSIAVTCELAVRSITDHVSRKVERLQVGDVLDTQRRRRDNLPESYVMDTYP